MFLASLYLPPSLVPACYLIARQGIPLVYVIGDAGGDLGVLVDVVGSVDDYAVCAAVIASCGYRTPR